jgi:hypothetical protein
MLNPVLFRNRYVSEEASPQEEDRTRAGTPVAPTAPVLRADRAATLQAQAGAAREPSGWG